MTTMKWMILKRTLNPKLNKSHKVVYYEFNLNLKEDLKRDPMNKATNQTRNQRPRKTSPTLLNNKDKTNKDKIRDKTIAQSKEDNKIKTRDKTNNKTRDNKTKTKDKIPPNKSLTLLPNKKNIYVP